MSNKTTGNARSHESIAAILFGMAVFWMSAPLRAEIRTYVLPEETARFLPGQDAETAEVNCAGCHSADYVKVQPPQRGKAFWAAEVNKMIKVFGAPIEPEDAAKIIDYLAATY
jgi:sulfite dehydrogenase (cytochrome) subunit B